jgi:hypothetical protein
VTQKWVAISPIPGKNQLKVSSNLAFFFRIVSRASFDSYLSAIVVDMSTFRNSASTYCHSLTHYLGNLLGTSPLEYWSPTQLSISKLVFQSMAILDSLAL